MFVVGLTGGIGCGKTSVTDYFARHNITIVDADIIAHEIVMPNTKALSSIAEHFGDGILLQDRSLDRKKLRAIIFSKPDEKKCLEDILHPIIFSEVKKQIAASSSIYTIYSAPLLIETLHQTPIDLDRIAIVDIPEEIQIARTVDRDKSSEEKIRHIIQQQASRQTRLDYADDIIDNSKELAYTYKQCEFLNKKYQKLARDNVSIDK